uniref:Reverse transcriptase Ty1/copia-type domain-containing protein n=1 Tax=Fagus sylvatica TaxID=28930 RepID=A0A2N9EYM6_FAGSY
MFELTSLHLPSTPTPLSSHVAHTASVFPLSLWHLCLDPFTILPIPSANSPVSPLAPPPAVDPILNQTLDLPLATPLTAPPVVDLVLDQTPDLPLATPPAAPPVVDPVLDQTFDLPLAAPPADSLVSPQEPTPPVDPVTNQTLPLPLHRSDRQTMTEELQALEMTYTWDLVDLPVARLIAMGYAQEYGFDYEETFAPVARITSVCSLLAIAAVHQWPLFQMEVKNAFLNGDLTEKVYMQTPLGYSDCPNKFGFSSSPHDTTLFIRRSDQGMILLLLYVDDMIIIGDDHFGIYDFKQFLNQQFEMKDLGQLSYFLDLEVSSDSTGYYLSQAKDLLSRVGLTNTKVLVGSLVYLIVTRLDIAHAVHLVGKFLATPHSTHYAAVIHILCYIKDTMFHDLHFSAHSTFDLCAYFDADWAGDPIDCRSTIEYRALADTISELLALRWLLEDIGLTYSSPTVIHCNNRSVIQIAHNDVFHERTKYIEIDCHLVRHHLFAGILRLLPVSSSVQTADIFTKNFPPGCFRDLVSKLKVASVRPP